MSTTRLFIIYTVDDVNRVTTSEVVEVSSDFVATYDNFNRLFGNDHRVVVDWDAEEEY